MKLSTEHSNSVHQLPLLGPILKNKRLELGHSVADVVMATKIRHSHIVALEEDDADKLPEYTYTLGYVASYARFLGLNVEELLAIARCQYAQKDYSYTSIVQNNSLDKRYKPLNIVRENIVDFIFILLTFGRGKRPSSAQLLKEPVLAQQERTKTSAPSRGLGRKKFILVYLVIALVVILTVLIGWLKPREDQQPIVPGQPDAITGTIASQMGDTLADSEHNTDDIVIVKKSEVEKAQKPPQPGATPKVTAFKGPSVSTVPWPSEAGPSEISLNPVADVWVKVYNADNPDQVYLNTVLKAGATISIPHVEHIKLDVGNYHNLLLEVEGNDLVLTPANAAAPDNVVVRGINLNKDYLAHTYQKAE